MATALQSASCEEFSPPERVVDAHATTTSADAEGPAASAPSSASPASSGPAPSPWDGSEPHFPVQVNFYFWLDNFLALCAQNKYTEAMESLNEWRRKPSLASRPRWGAVDDEPDGDECEIEDSVGDIVDGETHADRCRRCLAAYAQAVHAYMAQTSSNAAWAKKQNSARVTPINDALLEPWELQYTPDRGRTVLARRRIIAGEEIEVQRPLALLQSEAAELVCPQCLRCIGTPLAQWSQLPAEGRDPLPNAAEDFEVLCPSDAFEGPALQCTHGNCCDVKFCSEACRARSEVGHHSLLCRALLTADQAEAYAAAVEFGEQKNRHFLLAVHHTANMVAEARAPGFSERALSLSDLVENHVGMYRTSLWEALGTQGEEDIAQRLSDTVHLAALTERILGPYCDTLPDAALARELFLTPKALSRCIGMFQLVCLKACLFSPLALALSAARKDLQSSQADDDSEAIPCDEAKCTLGTFAGTLTGRRLSRPTDAAAMVPFVSLCNHSCIPNIEVDFRHELERPGVFCTITATRTIAAGEELNIQYMPVVATPFTERQAKLQSGWGFKCECVRCAAEEIFSESDSTWFCEGCDAFRALDEVDSCCNTDLDYNESDNEEDDGVESLPIS